MSNFNAYTFSWTNEDLTAMGSRSVVAGSQFEAEKANAFYELKGYHFRLTGVRPATEQECAAAEASIKSVSMNEYS